MFIVLEVMESHQLAETAREYDVNVLGEHDELAHPDASCIGGYGTPTLFSGTSEDLTLFVYERWTDPYDRPSCRLEETREYLRAGAELAERIPLADKRLEHKRADQNRCPECGGPLEGWSGEHHSQQCERADLARRTTTHGPEHYNAHNGDYQAPTDY